jgi:hypothetical protein
MEVRNVEIYRSTQKSGMRVRPGCGHNWKEVAISFPDGSVRTFCLISKECGTEIGPNVSVSGLEGSKAASRAPRQLPKWEYFSKKLTSPAKMRASMRIQSLELPGKKQCERVELFGLNFSKSSEDSGNFWEMAAETLPHRCDESMTPVQSPPVFLDARPTDAIRILIVESMRGGGGIRRRPTAACHP